MAKSLRVAPAVSTSCGVHAFYREAFNMYYTRASLFLGIALAAALFATPTAAIEFVGKVVGVTDGDTLTVLTAQRQQHRVRLSGIDAPERRQAFGQVSKQHLSDLAYDKTVTVVFHKRERYKRSSARCS
jgi:endonuclease YncB( thermonuclease family)